MKNKGNQSMVVLLCVLGAVVLITATLTGVFVYSSSSKTDDAVLAEDSTALKTECLYHLKFANRSEVEQAVAEYVQFYNYERINLKDGLTPFEIRSKAV